MSQISLGFCDLSRAYVHAKRESYYNEALGLNQTMQEIVGREYESIRDIDKKERIGKMLLRLQSEEFDIKFKLNFPEGI